jgi:hypothetical protein
MRHDTMWLAVIEKSTISQRIKIIKFVIKKKETIL